MELNTIDALLLQKLFLAGANNISNNKEYINELNVFPVPDGDTGTNMTLTIMAAAADVRQQDDPTIDSLAKAISGGSLRGARGNSGVILSQIFRGFCKDIRGKKELTLVDLVSGFERGVETAYKAVMKPKEGTILTVARGISEKATELLMEEEDYPIIEFAEQVLAHGEDVLEHTPELLPVLAEAGVVDSGGQGLIEILRGIVIALKGGTVELAD
ncbi:MAG: DAK2 domain-containing protein, partial [Eubacterium sp.]|nr:DAK2 domain-containing protein [Eubacterium sp.]